MANAAVWWSDSSATSSGRVDRSSVSGSLSRPRHFGGPALGAPRPLDSARSARSKVAAAAPEVPFPIEPLTMSSSVAASTNRRDEPTALCHGKTYRRGAEAPEKSSLPFFVLIGLAVGLFAFGMMTFCLPDPFEKIAAREAAAAQSFPPPVFRPVEVAPPPVEVAPVEVAPVEVAPAIVVPQVTMTTKTRRRHTTSAKKPSAKLPSNPYASGN